MSDAVAWGLMARRVPARPAAVLRRGAYAQPVLDKGFQRFEVDGRDGAATEPHSRPQHASGTKCPTGEFRPTVSRDGGRPFGRLGIVHLL